MHSVGYRNPGQLPEGAVLVVGSGSSGTQIAEELLARSIHRTLRCDVVSGDEGVGLA